MNFRKLRAPTEDGAWLIDPAASQLPTLYAANYAARPARSYDVQGRGFAQLVAAARHDLARDALHDTQQYRDVPDRSALRAPHSAFILAGHQPELFHSGVWAKNFVLARTAEAVGATAVNLVIDGDTLKTASLRVPGGSVDEPYLESVPYDAPGEEIPHEERQVLDPALFRSFAGRAAAVVRPLVPEPLLPKFWPRVVARHAAGANLGDAIAQARHQVEGDWGLATLEYRQSRMCDTPSFRRFALHLLAQLPRFHEVHNAALVEYRRREHLRSANHPVPALGRDDDGLEAPLWLWTADDPRRRRVFVRRVGGELELTDRGRFCERLPLAESTDADRAVEALAAWRARGIKLRSRALLTTMYARLVLGDLFIHGIGGGKYDELTDAIVRRFFGFEPPGYAVVTATRRLPIALPPRAAGETAAALEHERWSLEHHPERFLAGELPPAAAAALAEKQRRTAELPTRESARARCHAIREANGVLRQFAAEAIRRAEEKLAEVRQRDRREALLTSREFSSFLFPEKDLREFLLASPPNVR